MNLFLILAIKLLLYLTHPFYLTVSDLKYNSNHQYIEGTIKLTVHDLESSLSKIHGKTIDLHRADTTGRNLILSQYLRTRFQLEAFSKPLHYKIIGSELDGIDFYIFLESHSFRLPTTLKIKNTILFEFSPQQINIINIDFLGKKASKKLVNPENELVFE